MPFIKIATLTVNQLKAVLREKNLSHVGSKDVLVARLLENHDSDEVEINGDTGQDDTARDVSELREEVGKLRSMIDEIVANVKILASSANAVISTNNPTSNQPPRTSSDIASSASTINEAPFQVAQKSTTMAPPTHAPSSAPTLRDILEILPEFDPSNEMSLSAYRYVTRVNRLISVYGWNDRDVLLAVQAKLKGPARLWADALMEVHQTWASLSERLVVDFDTHENDADIHMKMAACTRRQNERVLDYLHRARALGQKFQLHDDVIIKYIRRGLNHLDIQNALACTDFATTNELRQAIDRYLTNRTVSLTNHRRSMPTENNNQPRIHQKPSEDNNEQVNGLNQNASTSRKPSANISCYNCFQPGHVSINCPKPQRKARCSICLRTTHADSACPDRNKAIQNNQPPNVRLLSISTPNRDNRIKTIKVNNCLTNAFIDTGSDRSLILESLAETIGRPELCSPVRLTGFKGGEVIGTSSITATVCIDATEIELELLIVKDIDLPAEVLLGNDYVKRSGCKLIIGSEEYQSIDKDAFNDIKINKDMPSEVVEQTKVLLSKYRHCFGENLNQIGKCNTTMMRIELTNDVPVNRKPYRIPFAKRLAVDTIVRELLDNDIVRPSTSEYSSPIVLVKKSNGEDRMCIDYRAVNSITRKMPYPMPTVDEILSNLAGKKYFTVVDLMSGYYQVPIEEDCKHYTAFSTHQGHFEFNRMPFGLVNAPATFQKMITKLIQPMKPRAISYVDEIIIPSETTGEGLENLDEFLQFIQATGLTLRLSKFTFLATNIPFLGHELSPSGITPGSAKVVAIRDMFPPTNVTELRRFLSLTGFFRKFVPDYAIIARPLTNLLKTKNNNHEFVWSSEQQLAYDNLKEILCTKPVLEVYDPGRRHQVHTDASAQGLAGILLQECESNVYRPVAFFSRSCTPAEMKYSSHELEILAVVASLERFRIYLLGKSFELITDCAAISTLKSTTQLIPRIARWWLRLQEFDFTTIHRPGSRMAHVDALSRSPVEPPQETPTVTSKMYRIKMLPLDWVSNLQLGDPKIADIITEIENKPEHNKDYRIINHRLYRILEGKPKLVVPSAIRWRLVKHHHDDFGHVGVEKTLDRLKEHYWFTQMRNYVKSYLTSCIECYYNKRPPGAAEGRLYAVDPVAIPFRTLHIDHLGPFPKTSRGNVYVIVVADAFTKFVIVKATKSTKTQPVISRINDLTGYFGLPYIIISDRGTAYISREFETYCAKVGICHVKVAVRSPRSNGQVERMNQSILHFLKTSANSSKTWDQEMRMLQWSINTQRNSTTGYSPNQLVFDFNLKDIAGNRLTQVVIDDEEKLHQIVDLGKRREEAIENIKRAQEKWKTRFDEKHKQPTLYNEGDLVVVEYISPSTGESRKLEPKYKGPYLISRVLKNDRYVVEDIDVETRNRRKFVSVFASDKLKPWCSISPEADDIDDDDEEEDGLSPSSQE